MDAIDRNIYDPKKYKDQSLENAYRSIFGGDSIAIDLVLQDLLRFTQYTSKMINTDPNMQYHILGQQSVLQRVKDMLNHIEEDEAQLPATIEQLEVD